MIFIGIINTIYAIIYALLSPIMLLPDVTLPADFLTSISTASSYLKPIDLIFPIDTLLIILGIFIIIEVAYLAFKFIMFIVKRFPTQS